MFVSAPNVTYKEARRPYIFTNLHSHTINLLTQIFSYYMVMTIANAFIAITFEPVHIH